MALSGEKHPRAEALTLVPTLASAVDYNTPTLANTATP